MNGTKGQMPEKLSTTGTIVFPDRGGAKAGRGENWTGKASSYYNHPLIKKADWKWQIILYFFLGGVAGGSYLVATLAHLFGIDRHDENIVRAGRYLSFVCILISPVLLIWDLGRPERFLHMLRVLKLRSVMSIGTWAISFFGLFCGLSTVHQMAKDGFLNWFPFAAKVAKAIPVKVFDVVGSAFGLVVASYTGVLLSSTAVPVWARAKHLLGPLFLTSAFSTGLASLSLLLSLKRSRSDTLERLDRAEIIAMSTEVGLLASLIPTLGPLGKPLVEGRTGGIFMSGTVFSGLLLPLLVKLGFKLSGNATPRTTNMFVASLTLVGGLILRYTWIVVGRTSADDPHAVHSYNKVEWDERHS